MRKQVNVSTAVLIALAVGFATGGIWQHRQLSYELQREKWSQDLPDTDLSATIEPTKEPFVFTVRVRKTNNKVDKVPSIWPVLAGFMLTRDDVVIRGKDASPALGEQVDTNTNRLEMWKDEKSTISLKLRLRTEYLSPGSYVLEPDVRVRERGRDAIGGPYLDGGSVPVLPGNSLKITIK